jgi:hypothetical protein
MGVVYEAHDPELERRVAIKVLRPSNVGTLHGHEARARLRREAQAMARLSHPNVAPVYEVGETDDHIFIVMELVPGGTLRTWLRDSQRTQSEILGVFAQAGRGLEAAHLAGLVHRDFKPENVLIGRDGRARVVDFGLVTPADAADGPTATEPETPSTLAVALTRTGALVGTPAYMAPEQHDGQSTDARTDQFSFCVTLWEALWGERPFVAATYRELVDAVCSGRRVAIPRTSAAGQRIGVVLARGLQPEAAARYPSIGALLDDLTTAAAPPPPQPRRLWVVAVAAAVGSGVFAWSRMTETAAPDAKTDVPAAAVQRQAVPQARADETPPAATTAHAGVEAASVAAPVVMPAASPEAERPPVITTTAPSQRAAIPAARRLPDTDARARRVPPDETRAPETPVAPVPVAEPAAERRRRLLELSE